MRYIRLNILALAALFLALTTTLSCKKDNIADPHTGSDTKVCWDVESISRFSDTKAMVETLPILQNACTKTEQGGLGKTIGIWADYQIMLNGVNQVVSDVFSGLRLYYNPALKTAPGADANVTGWTYDGKPAYWVPGGMYYFRAYYPVGGVNIHESASAKVFVVESNTMTTQEDFLVAYNQVDTKVGANMNKPVKFDFRHAMSALKFRFKFVDKPADKIFYSDDYLTSCWLENVGTDAFAVTGLMAYGGAAGSERLIKWHPSYYPSQGLPFYKWQHLEGIPFSNTKPTDGVFNPQNHQKIAEAYSVYNNATTSGDIGEVYTQNGGWIMILPQLSTGRLQLCFTTKKSGNSVFRVTIPEKTGTSFAEYQKRIDETPENSTIPKDIDGKDYVPGCRYTYTISISKTDLTVTLGISPWNRLDSSFDVTF